MERINKYLKKNKNNCHIFRYTVGIFQSIIYESKSNLFFNLNHVNSFKYDKYDK